MFCHEYSASFDTSNYILHRNPLPIVSSKHNLMFVTTESLDNSSNYRTDSVKANATPHFMLRVLGALTTGYFPTSFKAYTRQYIEIHNIFEKDISLLDQVRKLATKWTIGLKHRLYMDKLQHIMLFSTTYGRIRDYLTIAYNILISTSPQHKHKNTIRTLLEVTL